MTETYNVAAEELLQFIERYERLDAEKREIADQQKEVMAECKSRGYDVKAVKRIISLRRKTRDQLAEEEAVEAMYREAIGL